MIKNFGGNSVIVRVFPSQIHELSDEEIVLVNRVQLNTRLVKLGMRGQQEKESITIIRNAIDSMMLQEKNQRQMVLGARMAVKDIKKVFPDVKGLPVNSFVRMEQ